MKELYTGAILSRQEVQWIREKRLQGYPIDEIAQALYIHPQTLSGVIRRNQIPKGQAAKELPPLAPLPCGIYGEGVCS